MTQQHTPDTSTILLRVEFDSQDTAQEAVQLLEQRLGQLDEVASAKATVLEPRDPLTVIGIIGVAIAITRSSTELVAQLRHLITEIRGIVSDFHPAGRAVIESDSGAIEVGSTVSDEDLAAIVESTD
jgi:hypothetical protein